MIKLLFSLAIYIWQWLKKPIVDLWYFIKTDDRNYIEIGKCKRQNKFMIYLKKLSLFDELAIIIRDNNNGTELFEKLNIHDIKFNALVEMAIPNDWNDYTLIIKYTVKYDKLYNKTKDCKPSEWFYTKTYGTSNNRILSFKIVEKK